MAYQFTQTGAEIQDILDLAQLQIAPPYDSASSYTAGDYCTKDDGFYVCTASTSGTWDASKWSAVTVGDVLETANANISSLNATLTNKLANGAIVDGVMAMGGSGNKTTITIKMPNSGAAYGPCLIACGPCLYFTMLSPTTTSASVYRVINVYTDRSLSCSYNSSTFTFTLTHSNTGQMMIIAGGGVGRNGTITFS